MSYNSNYTGAEVEDALNLAKTALQEHQDLSGYQTKITTDNKLAYSLISGTPTSLPASDVSAWAKKAALAASDIPDLSGSYLPLSGGTISSSGNTPLVINSSSYWAGILFKYNDSAIGNLGVWYDGSPVFVNAAQDKIDYLLHSRNIGDYAPLWLGGAETNVQVYVDSFSYSPALFGVSNSWNLPTTYDKTYLYGAILNMPYRQAPASANTPDFMGQVFIPNGDEADRSMWYRTSIAQSWNGWRRIISENDDGNVLIGTTSDNGAKLQVNGELSTGTIYLSNSGKIWDNLISGYLYDSGSGWQSYGSNTVVTVLQGTGVQLKISNTVICRVSSSGFTVTGNISASGAITPNTSSDIRLKDNINTLTDDIALYTIMALNPVTFTWNSKATELCSWLNGEGQGFIAQEYEQIIPNSGSLMWNEYRGIDYNRVLPYIVKVEQNHETRIQQIVSVEQNHETRIKQLEQELQTLKQEYYGQD